LVIARPTAGALVVIVSIAKDRVGSLSAVRSLDRTRNDIAGGGRSGEDVVLRSITDVHSKSIG